MTDIKLKSNELLNDHYFLIVRRINFFHLNSKCFVLKDLLDDSKYNSYYINITKGILLVLISFKHIEIVGNVAGYKNFRYICKNKIESE